MPGSEIIIITQGGGGGNRTTASYSTPYPVSAGDVIKNAATSGPTVEVTLTDTNMFTSDIFLAPGAKHTFTAAGAIVVQP